MLRPGITVLPMVLILATVDSTAQEGSYSWFACLLGDPTLYGAYTDGAHFGGPFRANGPVRVVSSSPGRDDDPYFHHFTLSSDYYVCDWGSSQATTPHPEGTELWIEPYEMMQQGPPWFELGADEIPFGSDQVDWQSTREAAMSGGMFFDGTDYPELPDGTRIIVGADSLWVKTSVGAPVLAYCFDSLVTERVVWVENGPSDQLWIKGDPMAAVIDSMGVDSLLTIGCRGDIWAYGPLLAELPDDTSYCSENLLGLLSVYGDFVLADDPDDDGQPDWPCPFDIDMGAFGGQSVSYWASVMCLDGKVCSETFYEPVPSSDFNLLGGVQIDHMGFTCTGNGGLEFHLFYNEALFSESPPWYPSYEVQGVAESASGLAAERRLEASSNPFAGSVTVSLPWGRSCRISVFDTAGRLVETASATESWTWNAHGLPAGMYVVRAMAAGETASAKVLLLR